MQFILLCFSFDPLQDMQPTFEAELRKNLDNFKNDKLEYVHEYRNAGPMQSGLTPREASDKLILFQVLLHFFLSTFA